MGAALAYYTVLSLAPLLLISVAIAGRIFGSEEARRQIYWQIRSAAGDQGASVAQALLRNAGQTGRAGVIAGIFGLLVVLIGASGVFLELQEVLNEIWGIPSARTASLWKGELKHRLIAFLMVLSAGLLAVASLGASFAIHAASTFAAGGITWPVWLVELLNAVLTFVAVTFVFALIYRFFPARRIDWGDVTIGAAVTAALFTGGKFLVGFYLARAGIGSTYGAAGSLIVFLVWVYYSSQIFLLGAEFTHIYALKRLGTGD
jgi:membrane protein